MKNFLKNRKKINPPPEFGIDYSIFEGVKITYLCPISDHTGDGASGGVKVIYKHSEQINLLLSPEFKSSVLHPEKVNFFCNWFEYSIEFKRNLNFNQRKEFVIIPDFWAERYAPQCKKNNIKYGIFLQNGYLFGNNENASTLSAFHGAEIIMTISDDTTDCCTLAFPELSSKIMRMHFFVDSNKFIPDINKSNVITYMPRKLPRHSKLVLFFLEQHLPKHWEIIPIHNMTEKEVIGILKKSKIFLSFSELEGWGLPPIEAGLTGNKVIGYTGEGGKEYWCAPIFSEIMMGDIKGFVKEAMSEVNKFDTNNGFIVDLKAIKTLADLYSKERENNDIIMLSKKIKKILSI